MPKIDDKDIARLSSALRRLLDETRWPFSPPAMRWRELLEKLDPQPAEALRAADPGWGGSGIPVG